MVRWVLKLCLVVLCLAGKPANSAVISRDWKMTGDGLLTYDDVNQREWLDLSQTLLNSQFPGADRDEKYAFVVEQTFTGGLFYGFTVAKSVDVIALAQSAGIDTSTQSYAANYSATYDLGALLDLTIPPNPNGNGNRHSIGLLDETAPPPLESRFGAFFRVSFTNQAGLLVTNNNDLLFSPPPGVFLFRTVPESCTLHYAMIAVLLFHVRMKRAF